VKQTEDRGSRLLALLSQGLGDIISCSETNCVSCRWIEKQASQACIQAPPQDSPVTGSRGGGHRSECPCPCSFCLPGRPFSPYSAGSWPPRPTWNCPRLFSAFSAPVAYRYLRICPIHLFVCVLGGLQWVALLLVGNG